MAIREVKEMWGLGDAVMIGKIAAVVALVGFLTAMTFLCVVVVKLIIRDTPRPLGQK